MIQRSLPINSFAGSFLLLTSIGSPAIAASFTGAPLFTEIDQYSTVINNDPTDIYYPVIGDANESTPLVLLFQGALVDKADYQNYAQIVSSYGFTVVVPNNERMLAAPGAPPIPGLFPEQDQVHEVLDFMTLENANSDSPVAGLLDLDALGLVGHSFGGAVGLASTQNECFFILCTASYELPEALKAGIFYGANFDVADTGVIPPINNQVPTGLIWGTADGVAPPDETLATFDQLLNPPKVLVEVAGANHYGITNEDSLVDPVRPTLEQAIATETIGRWSGSFLRAHVLEDADAWDYIYTSSGDAADDNVTVAAVPAPVAVPEPAITVGMLLAGILGAVTLRNRTPAS
ncbi:MAG: PEP-CTERM sorting domain-containing protein [Cyanobacteria bacterium J06626_18]